ncbi:MAG: FHA domain-containing protein [Fibrobacterota bacterium]|nr:FHA domain-containing protein [Chitinispirillaceae bacterium]
MAKFTVYFNGECINTFELDEPVFFIGRLPENAISIANMGVSRRHAKIEEDADRQYVITDLNSLNGTYVNGKRIKKANLNNGDKIAIGKYTILYEDAGQQNYHEINAETSDSSLLPIEEQQYVSPTVINQDAIVEELVPGPDTTTNQKFQAILQNESSFMDIIPDDSVQGDTPLVTEEVSDDSSGTPGHESPDELDDDDLDESLKLRDGSGEAVLIETNKHVVYKLDKAFITMGNGDNDDIYVSGFMIGEGQISIEKHQDGYIICANKFIGKFKVNGHSTKYHMLQHKDRIEIGSSTFRYMENG